MIGGKLQEHYFLPALIEFTVLDQLAGVDVVDVGPAVVHQFGGVMLALEDT